MVKLALFKKILGTGLFFLCSYLSQAAILPYNARIHTPSPSAPVIIGTPTATALVQVTAPWTGSFVDAAVTNKITLGIDHQNMTFVTLAGEIKVKLKLEQWAVNNASPSPTSTTYPELTIDYQPFGNTTPYIDKTVFVFNDAYKYRITIDAITQNGTSINILPVNVFIDADIFVERYFDFSANSKIAVSVNAIGLNDKRDVNCDGIFDELVLSWAPMVGAEEYHLEWTFVNDYGTTLGSNYVAPGSLPYDFRHNSTRVAIAGTSYNLTLTFEHGYLLYRVRGIGRKLTDPKQDIVGIWSAADAGTVNMVTSQYYNTQEHEGNKNWQYSATYAEEGKKKEVISYFGGDLRNRQSVTKVNSDKNTIVGETIYDHQGRPAINVLPVPVTDPTCTGETPLKFYPNFNRNESATVESYNRNDFDLDAADPCNAETERMSTASGASNYYSPANPKKNGAQAFVPDGEKYPFTQIEYTPDNTGRIRRQGGVGPEYQLGKGHETKYYYGWPNQIQLDRLFGSEVGDAAHYKKNLVIDANGQVSVSYLDQEGRTIATSLAGDAPKAADGTTILAPLISESSAMKQLTIDLFAKNALGQSSVNTKNIPANAIVFNSQLLVAYKSEYEFDYTLNIDQLTDFCLDTGICFSCVYDLEIRVTDECGQVVTPMSGFGSQPVHKTVGYFTADANGNVASFNLDCTGSPFTQNESFKLNLPVGNYTVSKILTVNSAARDFYVATYLNHTYNTCVKTLADFQAEAFAKIDTSGCDIDCADCVKSLQTINGHYYSNVSDARDAYVAASIGTELEFDYLLEACGAPCKTVTWCEATYQQLLLDVSPDGQYAQFQNTIGGQAPDLTLSVLHEGNSLPKTIHPLDPGEPANWRFPRIKLNGTEYKQYLEADGIRSVIHLAWDGTNYTPDVHNKSLVKLDPAGNFYYTYPENLEKVEDFVDNWNDNWAKSLVQYHPEYCYYESCAKYSVINAGGNLSSDGFDSLLLITNTYPAAQALNLVYGSYPVSRPVNTNTDMAQFLVKDPFIFSGAYPGYDALLKNVFNNYQNLGSVYSMVEVAAITARCGTTYGTQTLLPSCAEFGKEVGANPTQITQILDQEWNLLKNFYLSEKRKIQQKLGDDNAIFHCDGYNGCIGNPNYNPHVTGMVNSSGVFNNSEYLDTKQPCCVFFKHLYLKKQKRFISPDDIVAPSTDEADYQAYLQTGQCPLATDLQYLLSALAAKGRLDNTAGEQLKDYGEFTNDLYIAVSGGTAPAAFIPYSWKATSVSGNVLSGNFVITATGVSVCSFILDKTGTGIANWDDIISISQLDYTATVSGNYEFSATAAIALSGGAVAYKTIHGSTCLKINACAFPPQGSANDLARDLSALMSALQVNHELTIAVDLDLSVNNYLPFLTPAIKNVLGTSNTTFKWQYVGNQYELYDRSASSKKLVIKFTGFTPNTYNDGNLWPAIKYFKGIISKSQNFFEVKGVDGANAPLVTIAGWVELIDGAKHTGVSMGSYGLPKPLACRGKEYQLRDDLEALLFEALLKRAFTGNIDLTKSIYYTNLIQSYFPDNLTQTSSVYTFKEYGKTYRDSLIFTIHSEKGDCKMLLHHSGKTPPRQFKQLVGFDGPLTPYEPPAADKNYYKFYIIGIYGSGKSTQKDTIWGESCLPLKLCDPCLDEPKSVCGVCDSLTIFPPDTICKNRPAIFKFQTGGCKGTPELTWNYGDGTSSSLASHTYTSAGTYTVTLSHVRKPACRGMQTILTSTTVFVQDCGIAAPRTRESTKPPVIVTRNDKTTEQCSTLYNQYVSAYRKFEQSKKAAALCKDYKTASPFYSYEDFVRNGLCNSPKGLALFSNYIKSFNSVPPCPGAMPKADTLIQGGNIECERLYAAYLALLDKYNKSGYAQSNHHQLPLAYPSFELFVKSGLCKCVEAYLQYLEPYTVMPPPMNLPVPVSIGQFTNCVPPVNQEDPCKIAYNTYVTAIDNYTKFVASHPQLKLPYISVYSDSLFTVDGFCYCVEAYVAFLQSIINGTTVISGKSDPLLSKLDIANFCPGLIKPPCDPPLVQDTFLSPAYTPYTNPCVLYQIDLAYVNAANAYQQYIDSLTTWIAAKYNEHCLKAFENFTAIYNDKEYHFTLYYYDQAGNLVKTIPPEGVSLVTSPADFTQINQDRTFNRHTFFTDHTMPTTYLYNSLNQLVRQSMPDHDLMEIWDYSLPNGLDPRLKVTATQFVTTTKGYLSGYITMSPYRRGYLYTTDDGGVTWSKMNDLVASDLKKIQMVDASNGFAVGNHGIVLKTTDGGTSWDMISLAEIITPATLNDLYFTTPSNGIIIGDNGVILKTVDAGFNFTQDLQAMMSGMRLNSITYDGISLFVGASDATGLGRIFNGAVSNPTSPSFAVAWSALTSIRGVDVVQVQLQVPMVAGNTTNGYAIGVDGTLLRTSDDGANWAAVATGQSADFKAVYFKNAAEGVAILEKLAGQGQIYKTTDAGTTWTLISAPTDYYAGFHFYQSDKGYAVGANGKVKRLVMNGAYGLVNIVTTPAIPTTANLTGVYFSDADHGWVTGGAAAYYTKNANSTACSWTPVNTAALAGATIREIYFNHISSINPGIALTNTGALYKILPSGSSYSLSLLSSLGENYVDIDESAADVFVFEKTSGLVKKTPKATAPALVNFGISMPATAAAQVVSIEALPGNTVYAAGSGGDLFTASATAWTDNSTHVSPLAIHDVQAAGTNTIYAVGNDGTLLQSANGTDWKTIPTATAGHFNAIKFNTNATAAAPAGYAGLIAADNGLLIRAAVSAATISLTTIPVATQENLYDVALNTANLAYVAGARGTLVSIPNLFNANPALAIPKPAEDFRGISFRPGSNAVYAVGDNSAVYNYNNVSGAKIKAVYTPALNDMHFANVQNGYVVGAKGTIRHTADGGISWRYVLPVKAPGHTTVPSLSGVWTTQADNAVVVGNKGDLGNTGYVANIGGPTGTTVTYNTGISSNNDLLDVAVNNGTGYVVGANGTAFKTSDNGITWTTLAAPSPPTTLRAIHIFQDNNTFMAVGDQKKIYCYNGAWVAHDPPALNDPNNTVVFTDVFFHDDRTGYVVGSGGPGVGSYVLRCSFSENIQNSTATSGSWSTMPLTGINGVSAPATVDIVTIDFASRYHGFLGGSFNTGTPTINYARLVNDETNLFSTRFYYDRLGRMIVSQNTKQYNRKDLANGRSDFSYTRYDALGRIIEVGELSDNAGVNTNFSSIFGEYVSQHFNPDVINDAKLNVWINACNRREVTKTYYDNTAITGLPITQENLRKRVATVTYEDIFDNNDQTYQHATHYSYDIHGNVKTLLQDTPALESIK